MPKMIQERLRAGVEYERHGDMEPDIYSANERMKEAADVIDKLEKHLEDCVWELQREESRPPHRKRVAALARKALDAIR